MIKRVGLYLSIILIMFTVLNACGDKDEYHGMSKDYLYNNALHIIEEEWAAGWEIKTIFANIEDTEFTELEDEYVEVKGIITDQFGDKANYMVKIQQAGGNYINYSWIVEFNGYEWKSGGTP